MGKSLGLLFLGVIKFAGSFRGQGKILGISEALEKFWGSLKPVGTSASGSESPKALRFKAHFLGG